MIGLFSSLQHLFLTNNRVRDGGGADGGGGGGGRRSGERAVVGQRVARRAQLTGTVPSELGLLTNMLFVTFAENSLTGVRGRGRAARRSS